MKMSEERRIVTILFADMTGSTELWETLDLEDVRALLERYFAIAKEIVTEHGGTLAKFIGDAVMAVFGLPRAHGDDASRALSAALMLRDRVRDDPVLVGRVPIRLGLNTGEIIAPRRGTTDEFLAAGDAVNVAARLQQAAESWTILCSERTARAAGTAFAFGPLIAVDAKGKRLPIRAVPLLGRAASLGVRRTPLIGREADLAQLELVARRAFTERRPFLVTFVAPRERARPG
jgi:class 3 adenylate cyclase